MLLVAVSEETVGEVDADIDGVAGVDVVLGDAEIDVDDEDDALGEENGLFDGDVERLARAEAEGRMFEETDTDADGD